MYPYFRAILMMLAARSMPAMGPYDTHISHHRAWPWDTDLFGELNNGRILTLFELARWQAVIRLGFFKPFLKHKMAFPVAGVSVRYRRRIPVFQKYRIQTRWIGYDDKFTYAEQSMWQGDTCMNQLLLRAAIKDRKGAIPPVEGFKLLGIEIEHRDLPQWAQNWIDAESTRIWPPEIGPVHTN